MKTRIRGIVGLVNLDDDLEGGKPELRVEVNREEAMRSGVNTQIIAATVQTGIMGAEASKYRVGEDEHDIRVRLAPEARASLDDIGELTVPDEDGIPVPIRTVAELKHGVGPAAVRRVDLNRVATIEGDVVRESGRTEASVREEVAAELDAMAWPPGYRWEFSGANEEEQQATAFLSRAFVIALLLILMVLVTQFDSLILPLTIITSVALSVIGVLWGLMLTGTAFGIIMTGIGVISLAGIVVNNAIVLCDFRPPAPGERPEPTRRGGGGGVHPASPGAADGGDHGPRTRSPDARPQHRLSWPLRFHGRRELAVLGIDGRRGDLRTDGRDGPHPRRGPGHLRQPRRPFRGPGGRGASDAAPRRRIWAEAPSIRREPEDRERFNAEREEARGRLGTPVFTLCTAARRTARSRIGNREEARGRAWNADLWSAQRPAGPRRTKTLIVRMAPVSAPTGQGHDGVDRGECPVGDAGTVQLRALGKALWFSRGQFADFGSTDALQRLQRHFCNDFND